MLVIAVDQISVSDISCDDDPSDKNNSGIRLICDESVRFTHAFTTSTLSNPAIASILTGLYPYQHGVHANGNFFLTPENQLLSEGLLSEKKIRTSFFSGGAPVWRKSGFHQGFEVFEDNVIPSLRNIHRPFSINADMFLQWVSLLPNQSYFSIIYVPDLAFLNTESVNEWGENRNLTYESQFEEFDQRLFHLFSQMKKMKTWENTTIVFVGLQGRNDEARPTEAINMNLNWETTQVPLLIKPWRRAGEVPNKFKIDQNISLADLGKTLFDLWDLPIKDAKGAFKDTQISFINLLQTQNPRIAQVDTDRVIPIESGWASWRKIAPLRWAFRKGHYLYLHNKKPLLYNTLTDRMETSPIASSEDSRVLMDFRKEISYFEEEEWSPLPRALLKKINLPYMLWAQNTANLQLLGALRELEKFEPGNLELLNWIAASALEGKDWTTLLRAGTSLKNSTMMEVAFKNLNQKWNLVNQDRCLKLLLLREKSPELFKKCDDVTFLDFVYWQKSDTFGLKKENQRSRFIREYRQQLVDQKIARFYLATHQIWDINPEFEFKPSRTDLVLSFSENQKLLNQIMHESNSNLNSENF